MNRVVLLESIRHAPDFLTLARMLLAVRERGEQAQ